METVIGKGNASSMTVRTYPTVCDNGDHVWITSRRSVINHNATYDVRYTCPAEYPYLGVGNSATEDNFYQNVSSGGVWTSWDHLGDTLYSIQVMFWNTSPSGDQTAGIKFGCRNVR